MAAVSGPQHAGPLAPSHLTGLALGQHLIQSSQEQHAPPPTKQQPPLNSQPASQAQEQRDPLQENGYPVSHNQPSPDQSNEHPDSSELKSIRTQSLTQGALLQPSRVKALQRNNSDVSGGGSEPDSLLDLYGYNNSGYRSNVGSVYQVEGDVVNGDFYLDEEDPESSRWIHRDKLARIEIQEMQQAGIKIGPNNLPDVKRSKSRDRNTENERTTTMEMDNNHQVAPDRSQRGTSAAPGGATQDEAMNYELRHPDEVQGGVGQPMKPEGGTPIVHQDPGSISPPKRVGRRLSHSKIPVPVSSRIPLPHEYIEGHSPSHRHGSGGWGSFDGNGITSKRVRPRSNSLGSQMLLDDQEHGGTSTPTTGLRSASTPKDSPAGVRGPTKPATGLQAPRSVNRDVSAQQKARSRSGQIRNSPSQRPGTRSGETPSGTPVKRPEGDPPWLAGMFKPDPRLPPDQQLIPTVAKRLQQEQWEREGRVGSVYDRDFNPVSIHESEPSRPKPQETDVPEPGSTRISEKKKEEEEVEWPLKSQKSFTHAGGDSAAAINGGTEHGGYKVIPNVERSTGSNAQSPIPPPIQSLQVETPKEKKATCGCCVMM
ncbi:MAG: hypothetical protein M1816_004455 [Peltula sp. TS41687]|nr:MAG: hypothetical protein M1816_004455 [Peltula sp. TS41687]